MFNHGLFVGVPVLALALAVKMARRSLTSAARRAISKRLLVLLARTVFMRSSYGIRTVLIGRRVRCRVRCSVRVSRDVPCDAWTDVRDRGSGLGACCCVMVWPGQ
jgi:uncharacterized membrane protein YGL010W